VVTTAETKRLPQPGQLSAKEGALRKAFLEEIDMIPGGDRLRRCIQCGTCSGTCPVSYAMDIQPRQLVAYFRAGDMESILRSRTIWVCASCYSCTIRCPASIKVTDLIYALKRMALERGWHNRSLPTHYLAKQFISIMQKYGRNNEPEFLFRYYRNRSLGELFKLAPLGMKLLRVGRFEGKGKPIKGIEGLRRIIARAEQIEHEYPRHITKRMGEVGYGVVAEKPAEGGGAS
jgi:heterodisulfide reductase subunit C